MQPINYMLDVQSPIQTALAGYMQGKQFRAQEQGMEMQRQQFDMQKQQFEAAQAQIAQQQARAQEVQGMMAQFAEQVAMGDVTAQDVIQMQLAVPEMAESIQNAWGTLSEQQTQGKIQEYSKLAVAMRRNPDLALQMIDDRILAAENAGDMEQLNQMKAIRAQAQMNPEAVMSAVLMELSTVMPPEQFESFMSIAMPPKTERKVVTTEEGVFAADLTADDVAAGMQRLGGAPETRAQTVVNVGDTLSPGFKKRDELFAQTALDWETGGGSDALKQLVQIEDVIGRIDAGEDISGGAIGFAPDLLRALANPNAQDAKDIVEEVVQRNLRVILGAQFTAKEGEQLIARAYNPRLSPEINRKRLQRLFTQMRVAAEQKQSMTNYFNENGTLQGYQGRQPALSDFYAAIDGSAPAAQAPTPGALSAQEAAELERLEALERGGQ